MVLVMVALDRLLFLVDILRYLIKQVDNTQGSCETMRLVPNMSSELSFPVDILGWRALVIVSFLKTSFK